MNKKLLISAAAISALCLALGLAACGDAGEGHTHKGTFSSDADVHHKVCTECGETFAEGDHVYSGSNTCTECGYTIPETAGLEYELDEETNTYAVTGIGTAGDADKVYIPAYHDGKAVTKLCESFSGYDFEELYIPSTVVNIECAITYCNSLKGLKVPDSVTELWGVAGNDALESVTFGKNSRLERVGQGSLSYCPALTSVNLPDTVRLIEGSTFEESKIYTDKSFWTDGLLYVGNHLIAIDETVSGRLVLREGTRTVAESAFPSNEGITEIVMSESLVALHDFAGKAIRSISFPKNLELIGVNAFNYIEDLDHITVESGNTFFNDGNGSDCLIETATDTLLLGSNNGRIPEGVKKIDRSAFYGCRSLTSVVIPASCTVLDAPFMHCTALESIEVAEGNPVYQSSGNCVFERESKKLCIGCKASVIPTDGSVTSIGQSAFYGCDFETFTVPSVVTKIEEWAFAYCNTLKTIVVEEGVKEIESMAFCECPALTSVEIPASVTEIEAMFYRCEALTQIKYGGTMDDWKNKVGRKNLGVKGYSVVCTNGTIPAEETQY